LRASRQHSDDLFHGQSRIDNPGDVSTSWREVRLDLAARLAERWWLGASIPRLEIHNDEPGRPDVDLEGLGDVALRVEWSPWASRAADGAAADLAAAEEAVAGHAKNGLFELRGLTVLAGLELPTGDDGESVPAGATPPSLLQLGSGTFDPILGLRYAGTSGSLTGFATAAVQWSLGESDVGLRPGAVFESSAGVAWRFTDALAAAPSLDLVVRGRDHVDGAELDDTGSTLLFATPSLAIALARGFHLDASVRLPLWRRVNGTQLAPGPRFEVGLTFAL
jgi:hypothetical protein